MLRLLCFALLLAGCAPTSEAPAPVSPPAVPNTLSASLPPPPSASGLAGTAWTLVSIGDEPAPAPATLAFSDTAVSGTGACNGFSGPYTAENGGVVGPFFSAGPLASTRKHCGAMQPFEDRYFEALQGARRWLRDGDALELVGAGAVLAYRRNEE